MPIPSSFTKTPEANPTMTINMAPLMLKGTYLTSAKISAKLVLNGSDVTTLVVANTVGVITNKTYVTFTVRSGIVNTDYNILIDCVTNTGQRLNQQKLLMMVR